METNDRSISPLFFLFLALLITIAVGFYIINPLWKGIAEQNKQIKQKEEEVSDKQQKIEDLKGLKANYQKIKDKITTIATALPTKEEHAELLIQLNTMALKNRVFLLSVNSQETKKSDKTQVEVYGTAPLEVKIVGDFQSMKNFISDIEKNLRILDITSIGIEKSPQGNTTIATLKIDSYYQNK
jgi:Tfp pilus assembly protein PilO